MERSIHVLLVAAVVAVCLGAFFSSANVCAQSLPAACDSNFNDVVKARATLAATREVEVAQSFILKPDSVLEYSCFHENTGRVIVVADSMFSDAVTSSKLFNFPVKGFQSSSPFAALLPSLTATAMTAAGTGQTKVEAGPNPPPFPPGKLLNNGLDNMLSDIALDSMYQFLITNFAHNYAGGTFPSAFSSTSCNPMEAVWKFVKCTNFDAGMFRSFLEQSIVDPRSMPYPCNDPNRSTNWDTNYKASTVAAGALAGADVLQTFQDKLDPMDCSSSALVKTGVRVFLGAPPTDVHDDAVCAAAGCMYDGAVCK